jgi:hypothetical protein
VRDQLVSSEALFVIDGIISDAEGQKKLKSSDINDITIMASDSAVQIYGKAVIIINTKKYAKRLKSQKKKSN